MTTPAPAGPPSQDDLTSAEDPACAETGEVPADLGSSTEPDAPYDGYEPV
jgi:hypothetical protein